MCLVVGFGLKVVLPYDVLFISAVCPDYYSQ